MPETQRGKPGRRGKRRGPDKSWWPAFLENLTLGGTIRAACKAVGINHITYYRHLEQFPEFVQQVREASDHSREFVVDPEIYRRAIAGCPRKKFTKGGEPIIDPETGKQYVENVYSDSLLMFYAKARWPEIYGDKSEVKHTSPGGGPIEVIHRVFVDRILADPESARLAGDLARRMALNAGGDGPQAN